MVKEKFDREKPTKTFRRVDERHQLDIFLGYNEQNKPTMIVSLKGKKAEIEGSRSIDIKIYRKDENTLNLVFSLLDKNMESIFYIFCEDIIESSRNIKRVSALKFIIDRWNSWRLMFKKNINNLLSEKQVRGLLGELIFIRKNMFNKYGKSKSISSWMGPLKSHKDFELDDTWYEVKTIQDGSLTIKVSSIEQLNSKSIGYLYVLTLEKTNENNKNGISLNSYIEGIASELKNYEDLLLFRNKLLEAGYYYNEEYDKYVFKVCEERIYKVDESFPKVSREELGNAIIKVSYEILMSEIDNYIEKVNKWN